MEQEVEIIPSTQLEELKLNDLIGAKVVGIEEVKSDKTNQIIGYWVTLECPYHKESEWFIPKESIIIK